MRYLDIKERKFNIVKDVQSKGMSTFQSGIPPSQNLRNRGLKDFQSNTLPLRLSMFNNATLNMWILKKKKVNSGNNVQSKSHVRSCEVAYHLPRISEKGFERFKEKYIAIQIHHLLLMQHDIFGY